MKKLLILLFALAFLGIAFADTVTVGTGTATGSTLPISAGWGYTYSQQIYTQAQINKSGDITKIRFYYVSGPIALNKDWVIYMGHTTKTTFATTTDWEPLANLTQVFAGDVSSMVPLANNWMEITLSTPFTYNNSDNLIVAVDENTPSYASMSWGAFTSGTNTGIYYRSDSANPDPATPPTASGRSGTIARIQFAFPNTAAPLAPTLVTPANGDWSFTDGKLIWNNNAGGADAASYDVYFGTAATPPLVSSAQTTTSYTPTLAANTTYYWNVVANNEIGSSPASSTWSFKTPTTTQVAESFEPASFPPAGWANPGTWSRSISVAQNGVASAYKYPYDALKYIVSLPKVTLTATSTLNFWTQCSSNNASAVWDVVWSTDRVTWTQVAGSSFTHPTASVWVNRVIDLSSLAGNSYYLGIRAGGYSYASYYFDSVFGPEVTPEAPGPVAQVLPADVATLVSEKPTFTWTAPVTGGIPTGYKIYCDTNTDPTTLITTVSALTYTFTTALNYETLYYWKVVATNGTGDAVGSTVRSFTTRANPTVATFPTVYDFGTLGTDAFPPLNWTKHSGVLASPTVLGAAGTGNWIQDDWKNVTTPANKAAKLNIYSTFNGWLISPPIAVPAADYEVMFDVAYMAYGSNAAPATTGTDDQFMVLIGDGTSWTPANVARQWDNAGSPYVLNNIPPAGMTVSLPFGAAGTYYVAFYAISTVSNADNDFMVDNITFRQTPAAPIFTLTPSVSSWDFGTKIINTAATKQFTITNTGGGTLTLDSVTAAGTYYSISVAPTDMALTVGESTTFTVQYLPTVAGGTYTGSATIVTQQFPDTVIDLSGSCIDPTVTTFPYAESFDTVTAPAMPLGWTVIDNNADGDMWITSTANPRTGVNCARLYTDYNTANDDYLVTPAIVLTGNQRLKFWARAQSTTEADEISVLLSTTTPTAAAFTNVVLASTPITLTTYTQFTVNLSAYTGTCYISFTRNGTPADGYYLHVDDVLVEDIPTTPIFAYAPATIAFGTALATNPTAYQNVTVTNNGEGTLNLAAADISLIGTDPTEFGFTTTTGFPAALTAGQSVTIPVRFAPLTVGAKSATLRIAYASVNYDVSLTGTALAATALFESFEGTTFPPADWTVLNVDAGLQSWVRLTTGQRTGVACASIGYESAAHDDWLITPRLTVGAADYTFSFYAKNSGTTYQEKFNVMLSTLTNGVADFTNVIATAVEPTDDVYTLYSYDLSAFIGENVYVGIQATETDQLRMWIDDVTGPSRYIAAGVPEAVTLTYPANGATGLAKTGFNFTWTPSLTGGTPTSYKVYMATDEGTMFDELSWVTTNTHFNPVTEGLVTFGYLDYYLWTVKAINNDGDATADPAWSFEIQADPFVPITSYPWEENFDAALTLPTGWVMSDLDGTAPNWAGSTTQKHSAPNAFKHGYGYADPQEDGWLITRPATIPATGDYVLSWWNYNVYPTYQVYNGVLVNTTNDPADLNWVELWTPTAPAAAWSNAVLPLNAYAGQTVYFAFNYQGYDGDDWYIDDVSIYEMTVDLIPPTVTHVPVLNTPRTDIEYTVFAEIVDDATWNNPIGGAELYYSTDATNFTMVAMVYDTDGYYADIPAQILGTTVTYYIKAWDSELNEVTTDNFSFSVNNPTWVWYDQGGTTYLGYTTTDYGPTVLYANPFYGTGIPMVLNTTDGEAYTTLNANLHVYSYDGTDQIDLTGAIPVAFEAQTYRTVDLTSYNINITTPYFLVAYQDIPMGSYFLFDATYDYGTSYVYQGATLYTMSNSGSWAIGVNITNGLGSLDTPVVTITNGLTGPTLNWAAVTSANSYRVYGAADPYAADPWTLLATTSLLTYTHMGTEDMHFFKVVADSAVPAKSAAITRVSNLRSHVGRTAQQAPKTKLTFKNRK